MSYIATQINLCTALIYIGALQIIITCFLAFAFSQFMSVLHCNIPTASGLLAGFITVPTVVQLRAAQKALLASRKYGFTIWYKRLAIGTCTLIQTITCVLTLINILSFNTCDEAFSEVMRDYGNRQSSKSIVDNVQWFMQCCGCASYKDWYDINWGNFIVDPFHPKIRKSIEQLVLMNNPDEYPDLYGSVRNDAVPFSCCAEISSSACVHQNLEQFGTHTINVKGCAKTLLATKHSILCVELIIYAICLTIELVMMFHLCKATEIKALEKRMKFYQRLPSTSSSSRFKSFHTTEKKDFSRFLNDNSSTAGTDV